MVPIDRVAIVELAPREVPAAHALVMREFDRFIGPGYSAEGSAWFKKLITPDYIAKLPERNGFSLVAKYQDAIVGLFSVRDASFITLFFVDRDFQGRGIGKNLFLSGKARITENNVALEKIDVHSSPYAEKIYAALGFEKTGEEKEEQGIRYVPMKYRISACHNNATP